MRLPRILTLYAAREALQYAALGFLGVGAILFTQNALRQLADFASAGLETRDVLAILGALVPMLSAYAVPVAFLFGVLVAVGRLSADSELTAMRALGVSLAQFSAPFFVLALVASAVTAWLLADVEPQARIRLREVAADVASRGSIIEPGTFRRLDREGLRLLFVDARGEGNALEGVLLSDRSEPERPFTVVSVPGARPARSRPGAGPPGARGRATSTSSRRIRTATPTGASPSRPSTTPSTSRRSWARARATTGPRR